MTSALPPSWSTTNLECGLEFIKNGIAEKQNKENKGLPVTRIETIADGNINLTKIGYVDWNTEKKDAAGFLLANGDILFSHINSPSHLGKTALYQETEGPLYHGTNLLRLRPKQEVCEPRFLNYQFRLLRAAGEFSQIAQHAVNQASINQTKLKKLQIILAPIDEQKRIADKLDVLLGRVDACRERLERVPTILKRFRQSVLAAATSGKLTEDWRSEQKTSSGAKQLVETLRNNHKLAGGQKKGNAADPTDGVHDLHTVPFPPDWEIVEMRDLVKPEKPVTYGILMPGPELEEGVPYIRVADFPNNSLNLQSIRKTSRKIDAEFSRSKLQPGDLLLSIRGTVGRVIEIPPEMNGANTTQDSARLSIQKGINHSYVKYYLQSEMAQSRMKRAEKGVAVRGINIGDVRALQIPIPPLSEQIEIVHRIEQVLELAAKAEAERNLAFSYVKRLTEAILARAFTGELTT